MKCLAKIVAIWDPIAAPSYCPNNLPLKENYVDVKVCVNRYSISGFESLFQQLYSLFEWYFEKQILPTSKMIMLPISFTVVVQRVNKTFASMKLANKM
jgi:hypothetical protein